MPTPEAAIPPRLQRRLERWLERWGTPSLSKSLRIEFSPRLRRAFGRCYQDERLIRLTPSLRDTQSHLLAEILCHEAAHAAVYERHGAEARPHGEEWEEMMRVAGFEPRVRIPVAVRNTLPEGAKDRVVYLHRCPVCDLSRHAARPMHNWRCRTCVSTRSQGQLVIRREVAGRTTREQVAEPLRRERKRVAAGNGSAAAAPRAASRSSRRSGRSR
jgi:predicted SprT family Zn-dependent metalloprotease